MSFLVVFCPVKIFGYLLQDETLNKIVSAIGPVVALTGVSVSGYLSIKGPIEWVPTATVIGVVGTAVTVLALENKRIRAAKLKPKGSDVVKLVDYLATYYWTFWEHKISNESNVLSVPIVRPDIPNEFAYAFGKALLETMGEMEQSTYKKMCERDTLDFQPPKWEFRQELFKLGEYERRMYSEALAITNDFLNGKRAFNRRNEENMKAPLLYCDFVKLLNKFHEDYMKILIESREKKRSLLSKQMLEKSYNLPMKPERFRNRNLVNEASGTQNLQPSSTSSGAAAETHLVSSGSGSSQSSFQPSDEPLAFLTIANQEPRLSPRRTC